MARSRRGSPAMIKRSTCVLAGCLTLWLLAPGRLGIQAADKPAPGAAKAEPAIFEKTVLPIFQTKCVSCHGGDKLKAGLDVRSVAGLLKGGETGPAVSPGSFERSELWVRIASDKMPPGKDKLTEAE